MKDYYTPNDTFGTTDSESISLAVNKAKETGVNRVVIPRLNERTKKYLWLIEKTIYLPSDIEIVFDNSHLVQADDTFCNMFANSNLGTDIGHTKEGEQKNITLRGIGTATLDGGKYNGLSEFNSCKNGLPHISVNTMLLFSNVSGLKVENLNIINQRWWGITNIFVHDSVFRNIAFKADLSRVDENGIHHPGELPNNYAEIYIKNADGIDLRVGCHNILIENITGFTEDDTVALTALGAFEHDLCYMVDGTPGDIHDVKIRNIVSDPYICATVRLLNDNGYKLYNIDIDGVISNRAETDFTQTCSAVRIGDTIYAKKSSVLGDTYNISIKNVVSHAKHAVSLVKGLVNSRIENIVVLTGGKYGFGGMPNAPATIKNCVIKNIITQDNNAVPVIEGSFENINSTVL